MDLVKNVKRRASVIVNNRAEGNARLTIHALMKMLQTDQASFTS